jgi:Phage portal protein
MSKKQRKSKKSVTLVKDHSGHRPKVVPQSSWERLATDPTLSAAFQDLSVSLQRSQALADQRAARTHVPAAEFLDYTHALRILDAHPELIPYIRELQHSERREMLRQSTISPELQRESPTQSFPQARGNMAGWSTSKDQPQGIPNAFLLRNYADNDEWLRAGINKRRDQVGRAEIAVVPGDPKRKFDKKIQYSLELIFDQPNERRENWPELASGSIEDLIVLGRGAISKGMTVDRKPTSLYAEDAATIKIYPGWDGDPNKPRYLYEEFGTARKVPLRNDELIMPFYSPATYRYSLSIVQVLMDTIKADIEATKQALRTMQQKPPPNAFQIPSASASQLEALRDAYDRDIAGQKELFWFGGPTQAVKFPLVYSAKDNQFLEYQIYLVRKICALLQMSPQSLGVTFDINKANGEVQQDIDENTGLIPLLLVLESYFNRELVADYAPPLPYGRYDLNAVNLRIMYPMISEQARQLHAQESMSMATQGLAGLPSVTLNQVLAARGELPAKGGDVFWIKTATGAVPWVGYDNDLGDFAPISTGGSLGSQDAAGGPDIDAEDPSTDEEGSGPSPDADGPSTAEKSLWYDARPPGMPWKPKYMRWSNPAIAPRIATKSSDKPWISKDEAKANKALRKEATRIFEEAAERGKKG